MYFGLYGLHEEHYYRWGGGGIGGLAAMARTMFNV